MTQPIDQHSSKIQCSICNKFMKEIDEKEVPQNKTNGWERLAHYAFQTVGYYTPELLVYIKHQYSREWVKNIVEEEELEEKVSIPNIQEWPETLEDLLKCQDEKLIKKIVFNMSYINVST